MQSAFPLPELREDDDASAPADVTIAIGPAPRPVDGPDVSVVAIETGVCAGPAVFWMDVAGTARLLVREGREIVIDPCPDAREGDIRAYLLGSAIGALLHQRGWLPLHASAVEIAGRAVAFTAPSGGGKSTMAMHLHHRGHRVIADDICAIDTSGATPRLWPGLRNLKLWRTSLDAIAVRPDALDPVLERLDKYRFPLDGLAEYRAYDVAAVVVLDWGNTLDLAPLSGAAAVGELIANTFRGQLVAPMKREMPHWRQSLALFGACGVHRLTRPRAIAALDRSSCIVEHAFS